VAVRHLNDVETMDSLCDPGLWHHLPLCASEEIRVRCLSEMKVVDDRRGHGLDATAPSDRPARTGSDIRAGVRPR